MTRHYFWSVSVRAHRRLCRTPWEKLQTTQLSLCQTSISRCWWPCHSSDPSMEKNLERPVMQFQYEAEPIEAPTSLSSHTLMDLSSHTLMNLSSHTQKSPKDTLANSFDGNKPVKGIKLSRNPCFPWTTQGFQSACIETQFLQKAELKIFKVTRVRIYVVCCTPQKERTCLPTTYVHVVCTAHYWCRNVSDLIVATCSLDIQDSRGHHPFE